MISFQKRFLFVHIPKTAGNSIQSILRHYSEDEIVHSRRRQDGIERFGVRNPKYQIKKHSTLSAYRAALGERQFDALYKFAGVRNPWDRIVSYYFSSGQQPAKWDRVAFKKLVLKVPSAADFLRLEAGDKDPFNNVDRIIRFETLQEDFRVVCAELEIPPLSLPEYNRSTREHYSSYYDKELRALVSERFAPEITRFGYVFEDD
jgi:hypothetical protein